MSLRLICTKVSAAGLWFAPALVSTALTSVALAGGGLPDECTTPPAGAGDCHTVTAAAGGCTNQACCEAVCAIEIACCDDFWGLDCVTEAASNPACAAVFPCPQVSCPAGGVLEASSTVPGACEIPAVLEDDVNGGCNSVPPQFQNITCGQTVCGTTWIDEVTVAARDTDWYRFTITARSRVTWTVNAEFRARAFIIRDPGGECGEGDGEASVVVHAGPDFDEPCPNVARACLDPGTYYAFVAHRFADAAVGEAPFVVDCSSTDKEYTAQLTCTAASPLCTIETCAGGASTLTQNASQTIIAGSVACLVAGPPLHTVDNQWARVFDLSTGATAGQAIQIKCIEHAIEANGADSVTDAAIRIHRLTSGTVPAGDGSNLVLLAEKAVVIPAGHSLGMIRANFSPAVAPPVNSRIMVELFYPDTLPKGADGPGPGGIWPGSNSEGQTGPVFRKSGCSTDLWTEFTSFPDQHNVLNIKYDAGAPCPADFNGSGCVSGVDLAVMLAQWSGAALYVPCPPFKPQDLNQDCRVNGLDLAMLLAAWGLCPGQAPPCVP